MDAKTDESHGAVAGQVERSVRPLAPMRAWKVFVRGWGDAPQGVTMARTRGRAIARNLASAQDVGYGLKWSDFRVVRSPEHDGMLAKHGMFSWGLDHVQAILCADKRPNAASKRPAPGGSA